MYASVSPSLVPHSNSLAGRELLFTFSRTRLSSILFILPYTNLSALLIVRSPAFSLSLLIVADAFLPQKQRIFFSQLSKNILETTWKWQKPRFFLSDGSILPLVWTKFSSKKA